MQSLEKKGCRKKKEIIQELSKKKGCIQGKLKAEETNRNKQVPPRHVHGETQKMGVTWWVLEPSRTEFKFHLSHWLAVWSWQITWGPWASVSLFVKWGLRFFISYIEATRFIQCLHSEALIRNVYSVATEQFNTAYFITLVTLCCPRWHPVPKAHCLLWCLGVAWLSPESDHRPG